MKHILYNLLLSALACSTPAVTQAQGTAARVQAAVGDGLRGDYYSGLNFEYFIRSRCDALIDFNWAHEQPMRGVPAEEFTVRWSGWLVPPVTGHYVLHLSIDDGARLWLDGKQLLDEWRGQPLGYYSVPVDLQAGRPYRLRLDYCQYSLDARALLLWERPRQTETLSTGSWRNLWGLAEKAPSFAHRFQETIPTRYLFSHMPGPPRLAVDLTTVAVVANKLPFASVATRDPSRPAPTTWYAVTGKHKALITTKLAKRKRSQKAVVSSHNADKLAAQLLRGQTITLRTLYFEQGRAELPILVQASLDTLAQVLRRYPSLQLEVQGHTDNQGDPLLNQQLSMRRAEAVCQYLSSLGVAEVRLRPKGLGGTHPVADNNLPAERPRNRRVVIRPIEVASHQP